MSKMKVCFCILVASMLAVPQALPQTGFVVSEDHKATITGLYAFVSYSDPSKVTFILNVDPLLEPGNGPTYFPFDANVQYTISIDNNNDAVPDVVFQLQFTNQILSPGQSAAFLEAGAGINAPANSPAPVAPGTPMIPPRLPR